MKAPFALLLFAGVCGFSITPLAGEAPTQAAPQKSVDPLHRESARSSVYAFLEACHAKNYQQAWRYIDLRNSPRERAKEGPQLAEQLQQVLDRDGRFDVASLSGDATGDRERVDSFQLNGKTVELDVVRVALRSGLAVWLFSADSVPLIPQLARMMSDSPIERHLPAPLVNWKLLDTPVWRWMALAILAVVLAPLSRLVSGPAIGVAELVCRRVAPRTDRTALLAFSAPLRLLLSVMVFRAGMEWVGPSPLLRRDLERLVSLLFFVALAWLSMVFIDIAVIHLRHVLESRHQALSHSVMPLTSRVLKIVISLFALAAVLSSWGYNTTTIVAGLGVGGVAIALASQKTIENLFGGVAVITDRPVAVGDFCRFGTSVGTVEDVGLRSTRIRSLDRTVLTVPNSEFSTMTLENFSKRDKMLFHITLNLRRDTLPDQVRRLLEAITQMLKENRKIEIGPLPVRFIGVGTYSLDLEVSAYVLTTSSDEFLQIQQDLLLSILDAVQAVGTALAVPTQAYLSLGGTLPDRNGAPAPGEQAPAGRR